MKLKLKHRININIIRQNVASRSLISLSDIETESETETETETETEIDNGTETEICDITEHYEKVKLFQNEKKMEFDQNLDPALAFKMEIKMEIKPSTTQDTQDSYQILQTEQKEQTDKL